MKDLEKTKEYHKRKPITSTSPTPKVESYSAGAGTRDDSNLERWTLWSLLNRINQIFLSTPDDQMYGQVLKVVLEALDSEFGFFGYINEAGDLVAPSMTREIWQKCRIPDKDIVFARKNWGGLWGRDLKQKMTLVSNRPLSVPEGHIPLTRAVTVPLIHKNKFIGALAVANKPADYLARDVELLENLARNIAPVLQARLERDKIETQRRKTQEALRQSEERFRLAFQTSPDAININRLEDGLYVDVNEGFTALTGYTRDEVIGRTSLEIKIWADPRDRERLTAQLKEKGYAVNLEARFRLKDGRTRTGLMSARVIRLQDEPHILSVTRDIQDLKTAHQALQASEEKFRSIFENAPVGIFQSTLEGRIIAVNPALARMLGYDSPEELTRAVNLASLAEVVYAESKVRSDLVDICLKQEGWHEFEVNFRHKEGRIVTVHLIIRAVENGGSPPDHLEGFIKDITERKRWEGALQKSEERYRLLVEGAPLGIIFINQEGRIEDVNDKLVEILGAPSVAAVRSINVFTYPSLIEAGIADNFRRCLEKGEPGLHESPFVSPWGKKAYFRYHLRPMKEARGRIIGVQAIIEDISQAKQLEDQLRQAQKMEAIGTLAGGIAHDFNNILAAIIGYTELAHLDLDESSPVRPNLDQVLQGAVRARDLVKQILTFSRRDEQEKTLVRLTPIVKEALNLLRASLPTTIEIIQDIDPASGLVLADPVQIHQLLMNLCTNAAQAMREKGGLLTIKLEDVEVQPWEAARHKDLNPGAYVRLTVNDTGQGMDQQTLARIFDPYFTTKEKGRGTGLGLAVVHGIVKNHNGAVTFQSQPGQGTTCHVYLPRIEGREASDQGLQTTQLPTGGERILLVDDETDLVEVVKKMLELLGYQVTTRSSSLEALAAFQAEPDRFDLVITDQTMPRMTGINLAGEILKIRPDIPLILCTGYSETVSESEAKDIGVREFLFKPIVMRDLAEIVRRVLDGRPRL